MKLVVLIGIALAISVAGWFAYVHFFGIDEIEYRGETFKLRKKYLSYEGFRNSEPNLATGEPEKIEARITGVIISTQFPNWKAFAEEAFALKFPGYAAGGWPLPNANGEPSLIGGFIEIPQTGRWRYFVLAKAQDESLRLIDDFVEKENLLVSNIAITNDAINYKDRGGIIFRSKRL